MKKKLKIILKFKKKRKFEKGEKKIFKQNISKFRKKIKFRKICQ